MAIDRHHLHYLTTHNIGRLATVAPNGTPQNKPVDYRYNAALGTIDIDGFGMGSSAKYRNVAVNPAVSFVVDDMIGPGAEGARFVELRGEAERVHDPDAAPDGPAAHLIRIRPRRLVSWNVLPGGPAMHSEDLDAPHT